MFERFPDLLRNGIDHATGHYLPFPRSPSQPPAASHPEVLTNEIWRHRRWWIEEHGIDDPVLTSTQDVDPCEMASAGWAAVFAADLPRTHRQALQPLLDHRRSQAGAVYREPYEHPGPHYLAEDFLADHGAPSGPADPQYVPYYLLLVGSPESLPFRFQYELDVQYAVGRLHFDTADEYRYYADGVIAAERAALDRDEPREADRRVTFFSVRKPDDLASERTDERLVAPLVDTILGGRSGWAVNWIQGLDAEREQLRSVLGGDDTPGLAFIACHGTRLDAHAPELREMQGSLVCSEWPGLGHPPDADRHLLTAEHLVDRPNLQGLVAFTFACYSGGTPQFDSFDFEAVGPSRSIAPKPFVSRIGQRLLGSRHGGALAVIAHVDRAWTASFHHAATNTSNPGVFRSTLQRLLDGHPVGSATEYVNQRYAEIGVRLSELWSFEKMRLQSAPRDRLLRTRLAHSDARSYVVLGDPAVRLAGAPRPCHQPNSGQLPAP